MQPKVQSKPSARVHYHQLEQRITDDHVFPRASMPQRDEAWHKLNKVPCCRACNGRKGSMHPLDWLALLPNNSGRDRLSERLLRLGCSTDDINAARAAGRQNKGQANGV